MDLGSRQLFSIVKDYVKKASPSLIADAFDHPFWDYVRKKASRKAYEIREQGFSGVAMLPCSELEYGGIVKKMEKLEPHFKVRPS